jgi:hypothetical protein
MSRGRTASVGRSGSSVGCLDPLRGCSGGSSAMERHPAVAEEQVVGGEACGSLEGRPGGRHVSVGPVVVRAVDRSTGTSGS